MTRLYLLEPEPPGATWMPFRGARPIAELRAGAWLIRERWEAAAGVEATAILGSHVRDFCDPDSPPVLEPSDAVGPAIVARADFVPPRVALAFLGSERRLTHGGETVAWRLEEGEQWAGGQPDGPSRAVDGLLLRGTFDLITALERLLPSDCLEFAAAPADPVPAGCIVLGDPAWVICLGAQVEPGVVFDVRGGVVVLAEDVEVRSGTRLEGPLYAGPGTHLLGGQIRQSAFGPKCRVHGEVAASVFTGYSNKSHDGFLGHSVLGQWVNLGAGTINSNLKNTYGTVRLDLGGERVETSRQFLGSLIGDHAKTAIGTLLGTGAVIGAGASVLMRNPDRVVPPFAWGGAGDERLHADGFVRIASRVMPRRGVDVSPAVERSLRAIHARLAR
jgi:UDP-N-acetylglucosamine diphosphorylase/glucosamine-1-phosphate N-acetyltransferase